MALFVSIAHTYLINLAVPLTPPFGRGKWEAPSLWRRGNISAAGSWPERGPYRVITPVRGRTVLKGTLQVNVRRRRNFVWVGKVSSAGPIISSRHKSFTWYIYILAECFTEKVSCSYQPIRVHV